MWTWSHERKITASKPLSIASDVTVSLSDIPLAIGREKPPGISTGRSVDTSRSAQPMRSRPGLPSVDGALAGRFFVGAPFLGAGFFAGVFFAGAVLTGSVWTFSSANAAVVKESAITNKTDNRRMLMIPPVFALRVKSVTGIL